MRRNRKRKLVTVTGLALATLTVSCSDDDDGDGGVLAPDAGPTLDEFLQPCSDDLATFDMRALINPVDVTEPTMGTGGARVVLQGESREFPEGWAYYSADGHTVYVSFGSELLVDEPDHIELEHVFFALDVDALQALDPDQHVIPASLVSDAQYLDREITVRFGSVMLEKRCWIAMADVTLPRSGFYVDHTYNTTFAVGENIIAWGNVGLTDDPEVLTADGEPLCRYFEDGMQIDEATYEQELAGDLLDCAVDDAFFAATSDTHAILSFRGPINSFESSNMQLGGVEFDIRIDSVPFTLGQFFAAGDTGGMLTVHATGGLNQMVLSLPKRSLADLLEGQYLYPDAPVTLDALFYASTKDQKTIGSDLYQRTRYRVISDADSTTSSLFVCHDDNAAFDPGETLQLAANIELSTAPEAFLPFFPGNESCSRNDQTIPCEQFEDPEAEVPVSWLSNPPFGCWHGGALQFDPTNEDEAMHLLATRLTPPTTPYTVTAVDYWVQTFFGPCAAIDHEVQVFVSTSITPPAEPDVLHTTIVPASSMAGGRRRMRVDLPTPIVLEQGEHLFVMTRNTSEGSSIVCRLSCGVEDGYEADRNWESGAVAPPYDWQTIESIFKKTSFAAQAVGFP